MKKIIILFVLVFESSCLLAQVITKNGGTCSSSAFTFSVANGSLQCTNWEFKWYVNGVEQAPSKSPVPSVLVLAPDTHSSGDQVQCRVTCDGTHHFSNILTITHTPKEVLTIYADIGPARYPRDYCEDEVRFNAITSHPATVTWYKNGNQFGTGYSFDPPSVLESDLITAKAVVTNSFCMQNTSVEISPLGGYTIDKPVSNVTFDSPPTSICQGTERSSFTAQESYARSFNWTITSGAGAVSVINNGPRSSSMEVTWNPSFHGTATITATAVGCINSVSKNFELVVKKLPDIPSTLSFEFCDFEVVTLKAPEDELYLYRWFDPSGQLIGTKNSQPYKILRNGAYQFKVEVSGSNGCVNPERNDVNVIVKSNCDTKLSRIESKSYNYVAGQPNPIVVAQSKTYFDPTGNVLQTQSKVLSEDDILTSGTVADKFDRKVVSSLAAPLQRSFFQYHHWFLTTTNGDLLSHENLGSAVGGETGTIGGYYNSASTASENVPQSLHPYSQVDFYKDGTGESLRSGNVGDVFQIGSGREVISGTFPVYNELDDYLDLRSAYGLVHHRALRNNALINVTRDQNGLYGVSISDREGNVVASARKGWKSDTFNAYTLDVPYTITATATDKHKPFIYFFLLGDDKPGDQQNQQVNITGSNYAVENLIDNTQYVPTANAEWPAGFYRVKVNSGTVTIAFHNYLEDLSYSIYDDMGRLKTSISPNGVKKIIAMSSYDHLDTTTYDHTDYIYNFKGLLVRTSETDAGISQFKYRQNGLIKFSQNALQLKNEQLQNSGSGRFSYTNYDYLLRPIESGEYSGNTLTFAMMADSVERDPIFSGNRKSWIETHYDFPDNRLQDDLHLGSGYTQQNLRGNVSWTQNENIATWYSYDELGRVTWMAQKPKRLPRTFLVEYKYDFLGNVLIVSNLSYDTTGNVVTEFHHHYEYDADLRLKKAYTSLTATGAKTLRATYHYYLHGPLKRIELGNDIQGVDFVYNIQGWLTHINHPVKSQDPGGDNDDVFGMIIDYYESDMANVFSANTNFNSPNKFHGLPESMIAQTKQVPLIRFALPEQENGFESVLPFKKFSAESPASREMMSTIENK